jgi:hypothetical protein
LIRKQYLAQFTVLVASAGGAQQGCRLLPVAKFDRRGETAFPKSRMRVTGCGLVRFEPALGGRLEIERKTLAHQHLIQTRGFAVNHANADAPFAGRCVGTQVPAADVALADQFGQPVAGFHTARPGIGMIVDADLVKLRSIDAVKPVRRIGKLDGAAIPDDWFCGPTRTGQQSCQDRNDKAHRSTGFA